MASLRELREQKFMTMDDLATKSGLNRRTIERLENNLHVPYFQTIRKLANGLGVDPGIIQFGSRELTNQKTELQKQNTEYTASEDQYLQKIAELDKKIMTLAKIQAKEMEMIRHWVGAHEINFVGVTATLAMILGQFEHTIPGCKERAIEYSKKVEKDYRDKYWPAIKLSGEPGYHGVSARTFKESK